MRIPISPASISLLQARPDASRASFAMVAPVRISCIRMVRFDPSRNVSEQMSPSPFGEKILESVASMISSRAAGLDPSHPAWRLDTYGIS